MRASLKGFKWTTAIVLFVASVADAGEIALDPETRFVIDEHWEIVKVNCTQCHSARLVVQTRADRETWLEMIRWMQRTQNLWAFPPQTEVQILDYLAAHYAPTRSSSRRAPLSPLLMPPAPSSAGSRPEAK
jgi:hypothetical protein